MGNQTNQPQLQHLNLPPIPKINPDNYHKVQQRSNIWVGRYQIVQDPYHKSTLVRKVLYMDSHEEAKNFMYRYYKETKPEFYIINPIHVELAQQQGLCSLSQTLHIYHPYPHPQTLSQYLTKTQHEKINTSLSQPQIWFLLAQLTHSLSILYDRKHPHLWITQNTIYRNNNGNWLLYDMCYWIGMDFANLATRKLQEIVQAERGHQDNHDQLVISNHVRSLLSQNTPLYPDLAFSQDIYTLGHLLLSLLTSIPAPKTQANPSHALQLALSRSYSKKMINLVKGMIDEMPDRRLTLEKLKFKLKVQEGRIIRDEMEEFRSREKGRSRDKYRQRQTQKQRQGSTSQIQRPSIHLKIPKQPHKISHNPPDSSQTRHNTTPNEYTTHRQRWNSPPPTSNTFTNYLTTLTPTHHYNHHHNHQSHNYSRNYNQIHQSPYAYTLHNIYDSNPPDNRVNRINSHNNNNIESRMVRAEIFNSNTNSQTARKNSRFISPESYRFGVSEARSPDWHNMRKGPSQFRYNSPHK